MNLTDFRSLTRLCISLALGCLLMTTGLASASGGYGGGGFSGGGNSIDRRPQSDPTYDLGKKIYSGRSRSARGLRLCLSPVDDEGDPLPLSRREMKPFKKGSRAELATRLVDCSDASVAATSKLSPSEIHALIHYLDQRFRLRLDR